MTDRKAHWEDVHSRRQEDEVSWFQQHPGTSLALLATGMDRNTAVIDIGAGASRLVDALLFEGFQDVSVLDISAAGLARARARLGKQAGNVEWHVADITSWQPARTYGAWHDRAVFHFLVSVEDRNAYRHALLKGTHPGSRVVIGTFAEDGPGKCSGLPVQRYTADALAAELGAAFRLARTMHETHQTPGGGTQNFRFCVFERVQT